MYSSSTSNDEEDPPASEELFMDDDQVEICNKNRLAGLNEKKLTNGQQSLVKQLAQHFVKHDDDIQKASYLLHEITKPNLLKYIYIYILT